MKVWLVSAQDWDGVQPSSIHRSFETAQAEAERLQTAHLDDLRARSKSIMKGFDPKWEQIDETSWTYGGWQVDAMEVQD